jgi:hypothetical protein
MKLKLGERSNGSLTGFPALGFQSVEKQSPDWCARLSSDLAQLWICCGLSGAEKRLVRVDSQDYPRASLLHPF